MTSSQQELPAWYPLAARTLRVAIHRDLESAGRVLDRLVHEYGPQAIPRVLIVWIDTMLEHAMGGGPAPGQLVQLGFVNADTGDRGTADDVPPHVAWAGRLMAARAADDEPTFVALIESVQSDEEWRHDVAAVLASCAAQLRIALAQGDAR